MLMLTRKTGQEIHIRIPPSSEVRHMRIVVDRITSQSGGIRLGLDADETIKILRAELLEVSNDQQT